MFKIKPVVDMPKPGAESVNVIAPFDGIVDRLHAQSGSLVKEGDTLTTLSDNSVMWVYFNVPEKQYLEFMANRKEHGQDKFELMLANHTKFRQPGKFGAIEGQFNDVTGTIAFRADFPNPDGLLRHGQTGTILVHRKLHTAVVIPQRATFEIRDKRYVFVVDKDNVVHRRQIFIQHEQDDIFIVTKGVAVDDKIVVVGIRQVADGEKVEYEFRPLEELMRMPNNHSE